MSQTEAPAAPSDPPAAPTNVIQALARVMTELPGISKDEDSTQGYKYRGIESITRHAQHLLGKHGVVFVPRVTDRTVKDFTINSKPWTEDQAEVVYRVYGPGGVEDFIDVGPLWGLGRDNSDKGMNKAMTQAFKYALTQTLCIGDGKDDPDREQAHESDAAKPGMTPDEWLLTVGWETPEQHASHRRATDELAKALPEDARQQVRAWIAKATEGYNTLWTRDEADAYAVLVQRLTEGNGKQTAQEAQPATAAVPVPAEAVAAAPAPEDPVSGALDFDPRPPGSDETPAYVEAIIAEVKALGIAEVRAKLEKLGLLSAGETAVVRRRLAEHMVANAPDTEPF